MNRPAKLSDLIGVLELESPEHETRFDRLTGQTVSVEHSILRALEEGDDESLLDVSDWQKEEVETARAILNDSGERFIDPPDPFDFHEYRHMERFIGSLRDERAAEQLLRAIKGRGAFRYFKDTAERLGLLKEWFQYRHDAMKEFAIEWADANNVAYEDDTKEWRA